MGRPTWCRFCGHPAVVITGIFPAKCEKCEKCDGEGFWSMQAPETLIKDRRKTKRPRVPFDLTDQDYRFFLKRIGVSKN